MNSTDRLLKRVQRHAAIATLLRAGVADRPTFRPDALFSLVTPVDPPFPANNQTAAMGVAEASAFDPTMVVRPTDAPPLSVSSSYQAPPGLPEPSIPFMSSVPAADPEPDKTWRRLQTIFNRHREKLDTPPDAQNVTVPPSDPASSDGSVVSPARLVQRQPIVEQESRAFQESQAPDVAEDATAEGSTALLNAEGILSMQPLPLQKVWPVQKNHLATPVGVDEKPLSAESLQPHSNRTTADAGQHEVIQSALENVAPKSPSDSSVELIPPRYPRPTPLSMQDQSHPSPKENSDGAAPEATRLSASPPQSSRQETDEPILTEIGPLPRDLWSLLGQAPPAISVPQPPSIQTTGFEIQQPSLAIALPEEARPERDAVILPGDTTAFTAAVRSTVASMGEPDTPWPPPAVNALLDESIIPDSPAGARQSPQSRLAWPESAPAGAAEALGTRTAASLASSLRSDSQTAIPTPWLARQSIPQPGWLPALPAGLSPNEPTALPMPQAAQAAVRRANEVAEDPELESRIGEEADQIDLDELARRVYGDIKRRLIREWERTRGRN